MTKTFLTSDWHLFHKKIQTFCPYSRKGSDYLEMTDMILDNVLSQASKGDTIYNLGDVSFGTHKETEFVLNKISRKGIKHVLIRGNHDNVITKDLYPLFQSVHDLYDLRLGSKQSMVMCHFPLTVWNRSHYGAFHIHGHSHNSFHREGRIMDVGIDTRPSGDMKMWELNEVLDILEAQPYHPFDH